MEEFEWQCQVTVSGEMKHDKQQAKTGLQTQMH